MRAAPFVASRSTTRSSDLASSTPDSASFSAASLSASKRTLRDDPGPWFTLLSAPLRKRSTHRGRSKHCIIAAAAFHVKENRENKDFGQDAPARARLGIAVPAAAAGASRPAVYQHCARDRRIASAAGAAGGDRGAPGRDEGASRRGESSR